MIQDPEKADAPQPNNRLIVGAIVFVVGQMAPLAIPLVTRSSLSGTWKTSLSGLLLLGVPEIAILLTVVVLGKAGFDELRSRLWGLVNRTVLPREVSQGRYYLGLLLFLSSVFLGWVSPYLYEALPSLTRHRLTVAVAGDMVLITGLCLMGGQFWDKLRALFVHDTQVTFSSTDRE